MHRNDVLCPSLSTVVFTFLHSVSINFFFSSKCPCAKSTVYKCDRLSPLEQKHNVVELFLNTQSTDKEHSQSLAFEGKVCIFVWTRQMAYYSCSVERRRLLASHQHVIADLACVVTSRTDVFPAFLQEESSSQSYGRPLQFCLMQYQHREKG